MRKISSSILVLASLVLTGCSASAPNPEKDNGDEPRKKPRGKFTISRETTYVTGPRDKTGYIAYGAALNKRLQKGVTPANNANVLI
jgi:outer membrane biogenesis lipoprotein LolB